MFPAADDKSVWDMAPAGHSSGGFLEERMLDIPAGVSWGNGPFETTFGKGTLND